MYSTCTTKLFTTEERLETEKNSNNEGLMLDAGGVGANTHTGGVEILPVTLCF